MKNIKKTLVMVVSLALVAALAIGGTVAYLTVDPQNKSNIFTVGDIAIELNEEVAVHGAGSVEENADGATYSGVMPGDYLKKEVSVKNTGSRPAYVAVEVTFNNALLINKAIDEVYEGKYGKDTPEVQAIYDYIFDGFGLNYTKKDANGNDTGMRLTITGDDMPEGVMQVDSVKTIHEYWQQYSGNWFKDEDTIIPYDGYYTTGMDDYQLRYTYYMLLEKDQSVTLFKGFNVPASFNAEQLSMFNEMKIDIKASAIQADNMESAKDAVGNLRTDSKVEIAKNAFSILRAEYADGVNDGDYPEYKFTDEWDGTADTTWYNEEAGEFELTTAEQLAGLAELVDGGNTFAGKTIKLDIDLDLYHLADSATDPTCFDPIGSYRNDTAFKGTFDGQGHTISNMYQNTWALNNGYYYGDLGLGLFGMVEDAAIKNLNFDGAEISGESAICGVVAAAAYGECTFDNITVKNSHVNDYQYYAGGVVGWASGNHTYKNINMDASTIVGSQWGDFGNANGGIIGGIGTSGNYHFEDCTVACRIDATNDVVSAYQWYNYRNSGMLIGRVPQTITNGEVQTVATPNNVTCKNVTVIYGDWANYTYCEFAGTDYPYVRVQAGVSVDAYSNVRYGHPTDANGNTVVDDNHVHNDGEAHHKLIAFDQLFGGPADHRYCYYGINAFDGVTVIYNNK